MAVATLPVIDLDIFRESPTSVAARSECLKVSSLSVHAALIILTVPGRRRLDNVSGSCVHCVAANALRCYRYGALVVKDSRVTESDNDHFLDILEDYFALPAEELKKDERKEYGYQVGVTLENTEKPKCKV